MFKRIPVAVKALSRNPLPISYYNFFGNIATMWQAVEDMVVFSLKSNSGNPNSPDCSEIAPQYGGGHRNAAGFRKKDMVFPRLLYC
jgi:oligoribonuclease NrnB/cAMP/cGMP phosphodiesterase (DHH superfamily)